ncbi:MAG: hypothetical protein Q9157_001503 [Trypethelium eluteriae]
MTNNPNHYHSQDRFGLSPIQNNIRESPHSDPIRSPSQDVTMTDVESAVSHQGGEEGRECEVRPDEEASEEEDQDDEDGDYSSDEEDKDTEDEDEYGEDDAEMMDIDSEPVRINFQPSADLSEADSRLGALISAVQNSAMTDENIHRILMDSGMQSIGDMYYLVSGTVPTLDGNDHVEEEDEYNDTDEDEADERGFDAPYTQSDDLTEANQMFDQLAIALLNGEMTEDRLEQSLNRLDPRIVFDMIRAAENRFSVLQGRHDNAGQRAMAGALATGRYIRAPGEYLFLRELEQQAAHRSQTHFEGRVDLNIQYTAHSLGDSLPGLGWAVSHCFSRTAVRIPVRLGGLDLVAECFRREGELFSWHQAISQYIEQAGQRLVEEMLFQHCPSDPRNRPVTSRGIHYDTILPDHRRRPMFDGESKSLPALCRIEADNVSWGRIQPQQMVFQELYDTGLLPSARTLKESLPGIDAAIQAVFGLFQTTRPINVEYLDYLAEHGIVQRGVLQTKAADSEAWVDALEYAIGDTSKQEVDDELFTDWEDPLPPEVTPTEQQLLHFILSRDRDLSDRFRVIFKSMYAAHREHDDRREVQEASEQLRAIVQRQIQSIGILPPTVYFPQTLELYEADDEARRLAAEDDAAGERERRPRPPLTEDHDCCDDYSEEAAFREDDRAWNMRLEELSNQPPDARFVNTWFLLMSQRLAEDDTEEERWRQWGGIQRRLQRLNSDALYRVAFRNMTEGVSVVDPLRVEERRQRDQCANSQQETLVAQESIPPPEADSMTQAERLDFLAAEYARISQRDWHNYVEVLQNAPREVRDRVAEHEDSWRDGRIASWNNGLGCFETPAQNLVREFHENENLERAMRGQLPMMYMEYELEIARFYDTWSHHRMHEYDLNLSLRVDGPDRALGAPGSDGPQVVSVTLPESMGGMTLRFGEDSASLFS